MRQLNSFADVLTDLERLLASAEANAQLLPGLDLAKVPLLPVIADLRRLLARRDTLNADKQVLSQEIIRILRQIREQSTEIRAVIRAKLGTRSEKLVEFRVAPRRPGKRRKKGATPQPSPVSEAKQTATPPAAG